MLFEDTYLTIQKKCEGIYKEKGSKFIAFAYPVTSEEEIKKHLASLRKEHVGARHHCYAFRLGADKLIYRANDDGEPAYTAGKPILGQIVSNDLTDILIVVVRYFGGTLLGVSGLINAYKQAAADVLANSEIIEKVVRETYEITFEYPQMEEVMKILKDEDTEQLKREFELNCTLLFSVRKNNSNRIYENLNKINGLDIKHLT